MHNVVELGSFNGIPFAHHIYIVSFISSFGFVLISTIPKLMSDKNKVSISEIIAILDKIKYFMNFAHILQLSFIKMHHKVSALCQCELSKYIQIRYARVCLLK